jgi:hypothetical protein
LNNKERKKEEGKIDQALEPGKAEEADTRL